MWIPPFADGRKSAGNPPFTKQQVKRTENWGKRKSMTNNNNTGYGKPPENKQFKRGQSGNPQGRPTGSKNTYKLLNDILNQKIVVLEGDEKIKISKKMAMLTQLVNKGVKGDIKAIAA
jgi:hypothetical protein